MANDTTKSDQTTNVHPRSAENIIIENLLQQGDQNINNLEKQSTILDADLEKISRTATLAILLKSTLFLLWDLAPFFQLYSILVKIL